MLKCCLKRSKFVKKSETGLQNSRSLRLICMVFERTLEESTAVVKKYAGKSRMVYRKIEEGMKEFRNVSKDLVRLR